LARKAARRKEVKAHAPRRPAGGRALLQLSARWPLLECLVTKSWQEPGEIVQIVVARRSPSGQVAAGVFLVDLGCLGVKNAFASLLDSALEYRQELRSRFAEQQTLVPADLNLVAKIIREGVAYASSLGFKPNRDYRDALLVLGPADPDACATPIPLGDGTGRPLFISGPYDNVPKIMRQLAKAVGEGNYEFTSPVESMSPDFFE
jgi:hypothetical protein